MNKGIISVEKYCFDIEFFDTETSKIIYENLPIIGKINFWGNEVYFHTNLKIKKEKNARAIVKKGELAFWSEGGAVAIGYGPTPVSEGNEIRLATKCNIWGRTYFNLEKLNRLKNHAIIKVLK